MAVRNDGRWVPILRGGALLALMAGLALLDPLAPAVGVSAAAAAEEGEEERETRETPAMTERAYKKLSAAQEKIDEDAFPAALEALQEMQDLRGLNEYEKASMWNMYAFVYYQQEDYAKAIDAYKKVISTGGEKIPRGLEESTLYALGQLHFVQEEYGESVQWLQRWFDVAQNPGPRPFIFLAQAYYQLERYRDAIPVVETAMDVARERGQEVKENWWLLLRAMYFELEDWPNVIDVLETLVREFPEKEYYVQLSGIYGQEGDEEKQIATIWAAYIQGLLDKQQEFVNLSGLMVQGQVPYWGARILEHGLEQGVVEESTDHLRQLGQAYQLAQETDLAIPAYRRAAERSDNGELYYRIAQLYLDKDECEPAIEAADSALDKGGLDDKRDAVHVVKGMCQFNLNRLGNALETFRTARRIARNEGDDSTEKNAGQWITYIQNEQRRLEQMRQG